MYSFGSFFCLFCFFADFADIRNVFFRADFEGFKTFCLRSLKVSQTSQILVSTIQISAKFVCCVTSFIETQNLAVDTNFEVFRFQSSYSFGFVFLKASMSANFRIPRVSKSKKNTPINVWSFVVSLTVYIKRCLCFCFSNSGLQIRNIYSIYRSIEDENFNHDLGNKQLLFHASQVSIKRFKVWTKIVENGQCNGS